MSVPTKFRAHCQNLVDSLTGKVKDDFARIEDDLGRIKFIYPLAVKVQITLPEGTPKDYKRSESLKLSGNKLFQSRNFFHAVSVYNEALLRCPQDSSERQLRDIIIANRSAVFFECGEYRKVISDVNFLRDLGCHPTPHKLYFRAGRAYEALNLKKSAFKYYTEALDALQRNADIKDEDKKKQTQEIEDKIKSLKSKKLVDAPQSVEHQELEVKSRNISYPALSSKIVVKCTPGLGRYVVAREDIKAGEIIASEKPYVCVIHGNIYRTNCAFCLISTDQPIACERCSQACFCSLDCKKASAHYHNIECSILEELFATGASVNCLMALRIITRRSCKEILAESNNLVKERNVVIYKTDDYNNVYNLVSHSDSRNSDEFVHYTFMAIYLLRLLKMTEYFGKPTDDTILSEDEAYIGSLILRNLQILQFNAHEISEIQNTTEGENITNKLKSSAVGAGLYPTLALFNHSCDPSLIRYTVGNVMVLRAIKPIKTNEGVFENYGPLFTNEKREVRIQKLKEQYRFECQCLPCLENWPQFEDINANVLRIRCDCGAAIVTPKDLEAPFVTCNKCKKDKNILPMLKALIPLEMKAATVEKMFSNGEYKATMEIIVEMLQVYIKHLVPPFTDMILLQQRLKTCMAHLGNKSYIYQKSIEKVKGPMQKYTI